jgi:hypothetical protein
MEDTRMYVATHQVETNLFMQTMENFNLSRTILIDPTGRSKEVGGVICKITSPLQITPPTSHEFCKSPLPPSHEFPLGSKSCDSD